MSRCEGQLTPGNASAEEMARDGDRWAFREAESWRAADVTAFSSLSELYFLIVKFLSAGPCRDAAEVSISQELRRRASRDFRRLFPHGDFGFFRC